MSASDFERRRFPRAEIPCKIVVDSRTKMFATRTVNISEGGIRVVLKARLDTLIDIGLELMIEGEKAICCKGKVAWVLERPDTARNGAMVYDTGIEFRDLAEGDRNLIRELINKIVAQNGQ